MIHFRCPRCGQTFVAPEPAAGARTDCPECGQRVAVPPVPPTVVHRAKTTNQALGAKTASPAKTTAHPPSSQTRLGELTGDGGEVPEVLPASQSRWDVDLVPTAEKGQTGGTWKGLLRPFLFTFGGLALAAMLLFVGILLAIFLLYVRYLQLLGT